MLLSTAYSQFKYEDAFYELEEAIKERDYFHNIKVRRIDSLMNSNEIHEFSGQLRLFNEYSVFIYDSALKYAISLYQLGTENKNPEQLNIARLKLAFTFLAGGYFAEASDSLNVLQKVHLPPNYLPEYYFISARTNFERAEFLNDNHYSLIYDSLGVQACNNAIRVSEQNSSIYLSMQSLLYIRNNKPAMAIKLYEDVLLNQPEDYSLHDYAIIASSISFAYQQVGNTEKSLDLIARAATADIYAATKETVALRVLAEEFFQAGEVKKAYEYIRIALEEATFYEANHRKIQISNILPIIEKEHLSQLAQQRKRLLISLVILATSLTLVVILVLIIATQYSKIKSGRSDLEKANKQLTTVNLKLREVSQIKDFYIGHFFKAVTDNIEKTEKLKKVIHRLMTTQNYSEIKTQLKSIDIKLERENLFLDFDESFLSIFPNFMEQLNALFSEGKKIVIEDNKKLPPEVRIVALFRLGINDAGKMARILNYSENTIYTYKTRLRKMSRYSKEEFESRIMEIKAVD